MLSVTLRASSRVNNLSFRNRATFETNIRPTTAAKRNHSRSREESNSENKTPVSAQRLWNGLGGGPSLFLRRMSVRESGPLYAGALHSQAT
jgi:hypothetical protein